MKGLRYSILCALAITVLCDLSVFAKQAGGEEESSGDKPVQETPFSAQAQNLLSPDFHLVQMKLSGSMCLACLRQLEKKILERPGVEKFAVLEQKPSRSSLPDGLNGVESRLVYDRSKVRLSELKEMIMSKGYIMYRITDKPVASLDYGAGKEAN